MPISFVFVFLLAAVLAGAVVYVGYLIKKKRRESFAQLATQLGLQYSTDDSFGTLSEPFSIFAKGDGRGVENVVWGSWQSIDLRAFDFWYYDQSTDSNGRTNRTYHRFDCVIVPIDADCVRLSIAHETIATRLADALSFHDIEFESEAFNRAYNVKSANKKFANDLIDARMMDWLMNSGAGYSFEIVGREVMCYCRKLHPLALVPLLGTAKGFLDHVPKVVHSLYPRSAG